MQTVYNSKQAQIRTSFAIPPRMVQRVSPRLPWDSLAPQQVLGPADQCQNGYCRQSALGQAQCTVQSQPGQDCTTQANSCTANYGCDPVSIRCYLRSGNVPRHSLGYSSMSTVVHLVGFVREWNVLRRQPGSRLFHVQGETRQWPIVCTSETVAQDQCESFSPLEQSACD